MACLTTNAPMNTEPEEPPAEEVWLLRALSRQAGEEFDFRRASSRSLSSMSDTGALLSLVDVILRNLSKRRTERER